MPSDTEAKSNLWGSSLLVKKMEASSRTRMNWDAVNIVLLSLNFEIFRSYAIILNAELLEYIIEVYIFVIFK